MRTTLTLISAFFFTVALAAAAPCVSGGANLVTNCGFETGDLTGWTLAGTDSRPADNGIDYGVDAADAHSGQYGAYLAGFGGVLYLEQTLATTPGQIYDISFWLATPESPTSPYVESADISFGGTTLLNEQAPAASPYTLYTYDATASSTGTVLSFGFRDDTNFFSLDDVTVKAAAVPEPASLPLWLAITVGIVAFGRRKKQSVLTAALSLRGE